MFSFFIASVLTWVNICNRKSSIWCVTADWSILINLRRIYLFIYFLNTVPRLLEYPVVRKAVWMNKRMNSKGISLIFIYVWIKNTCRNQAFANQLLRTAAVTWLLTAVSLGNVGMGVPKTNSEIPFSLWSSTQTGGRADGPASRTKWLIWQRAPVWTDKTKCTCGTLFAT